MHAKLHSLLHMVHDPDTPLWSGHVAAGRLKVVFNCQGRHAQPWACQSQHVQTKSAYPTGADHTECPSLSAVFAPTFGVVTEQFCVRQTTESAHCLSALSLMHMVHDHDTPLCSRLLGLAESRSSLAANYGMHNLEHASHSMSRWMRRTNSQQIKQDVCLTFDWPYRMMGAEAE